MIAKNLNCDFIELSNGFTRINVKIKSNEETEVNGNCPNISEEDLQKLYDKIDNLKNGDILVLAGSIPSTVDDKLYENIMKRLEDKNIKIVVDATKNLFTNPLVKGMDSAYRESNTVLESILAEKNPDVKSKLEAFKSTLMSIWE